MGNSNSKEKEGKAGEKDKNADSNKGESQETHQKNKRLERNKYLETLTEKDVKELDKHKQPGVFDKWQPIRFTDEVIKSIDIRSKLYEEYKKILDTKLNKMGEDLGNDDENQANKQKEEEVALRTEIYMAESTLLDQINAALDDWKSTKSPFKEIEEAEYSDKSIKYFANLAKFIWRVLGNLFQESYQDSKVLLSKIEKTKLKISDKTLNLVYSEDRTISEKYEKHLKEKLAPRKTTGFLYDSLDKAIEEIEEYLERLKFSLNVANSYIHFACSAYFDAGDYKESRSDSQIGVLYIHLKDLISFVLKTLDQNLGTIEDFERTSTTSLLTSINATLDINGENKVLHLENIGKLKERIVNLRRVLMGMLQELKDSLLTALENDIEDLGTGFHGKKAADEKKDISQPLANQVIWAYKDDDINMMVEEIEELQQKIFYFNRAKSIISPITNMNLALSAINVSRTNLTLLQKLITRNYLIHIDKPVNPIFSCEYKDSKDKIEDLIHYISSKQPRNASQQAGPATGPIGQDDGLPPFEFEPGLVKVAFEHCIAMAEEKSFVTRVSKHPDLKARCEACGCSKAGGQAAGAKANIQAAQSIVQLGQLDHSRAVFEILLDDGSDNKKNREFFLEARFTKLGYGFVYLPEKQVYFITFIFAEKDYETNYSVVEAYYSQLVAKGKDKKLMLEIEEMNYEKIKEEIINSEKKAESEKK